MVWASCTPLVPIPLHKKDILKLRKIDLGHKKRVIFAIENQGAGLANNVGIQVQLPPGMDFVKARDERVPKQVAATINGQRRVPDVYNATARTVTWWPLPFESWQSYIFHMKVHIEKERAANYTLVINSFQQTQALNLNETTFPYCQNPVINITVRGVCMVVGILWWGAACL